MGLIGAIASFLGGNENYPPPKVLFNWGTGDLVPLVWNIEEVTIRNTHFHHGDIRGIIGVPWRAEVGITLTIDEDNIFNRANNIVKMVNKYVASAESLAIESISKSRGGRREQIGLYNLLGKQDF